ncbi:hypothetical protein Mycch_5148 [Mycolicibacterium chubuense NBB4]|uniref:Transmembrane protein n=1 Tax=Mycolicibacterium chubuense (strain NBB4) TaxID=710421 RepID=I4BRC7_MYCCN|nr:membrane protein [Mycolicibacterium chubuense]AFM19834.1 hypothetical protein Mycch_5148 [Mycolicibacterium chubuense NBB4]
MNPMKSAFRGVARVADATAAAAGAVGGAAINGVVGGLQGAANGARSGLTSGSHSSAAAALTLGVIGAAGLVEWPVLVTVGGTVLVLHQLSQRSGHDDHAVVVSSNGSGAAPRKSAPRPRATARKPAKTARKSAAPRRTTSQ